MSKKNPKTARGERKNTLVILLMLLIAAGACVLAGYTFYELKNFKAAMSTEKQDGKKEQAEKIEAPLYVKMESFTVSLNPEPDDADRVLYVGITLKINDEISQKTLEKFMPEARGRIFILLANQTARELSTQEGKRQLIEKIKTTISEPFVKNQRVAINDVLFNEFILR
ncbi:flagellar basal body-associated protein FliL [Pantoea sp.]|uniref:flagellar basal body-associated protein FliL n=1 Tax=Pantoea sp. TaxID=69393 RepID=UPI00289CBDD2|nr:flagellar basal body-associated protein FliL [Pantoea sp.]